MYIFKVNNFLRFLFKDETEYDSLKTIICLVNFYFEYETLLASAMSSHPQPTIAKVVVNEENVSFLK